MHILGGHIAACVVTGAHRPTLLVQSSLSRVRGIAGFFGIVSLVVSVVIFDVFAVVLIVVSVVRFCWNCSRRPFFGD
jgi:hypothetical protein